MDLESELISPITQLLFPDQDLDSKAISLITRIVSLVSSMDLNSQPKPESEFMSLITQATSVFYSMDLDFLPTPLPEFISYISKEISLPNSIDSDLNGELLETIDEILTLEPEPELLSIIYQILSLFISMKSKSEKLISLCPQIQVTLKQKGNFHVSEKVPSSGRFGKWECLPVNWVRLKFPRENTTHFYCEGCDGKNHEEYEKAPVEIKHHLHRKHFLQLVLLEKFTATRQCYCCDEDLERVFYCCLSCDFAINLGCVRKPPVLSIDHLKWHEHTLHLFPRHTFLTCNLCALADASSPIYMCPNCDFVAHLRCVNLPRVIRISRHHHRISFTPSFDHGDLSCCVCRREIHNDYGGYSCIKEGCSYAVHSTCATQKNVWDGKELEGEPEEEDIKEVEPFVKISDGIIQHFSHQHHHLRLDENTSRDYDENKECQACITPIYFGNFYSCMQCDFILHEKCAKLSRKIYHPIHPHLLTLRYEHVLDHKNTCTTCLNVCMAGFFYKCGKEGCDFKLHVQCATIYEPLVHESHIHPLFLTSKPGEERRICSICEDTRRRYDETNEPFNCIECDFALCFRCATLPQKVRYKHDKHILTLSYEDETSTMTYWCEVCEGKVNPKKRFYMCDEYCCVTLHIKCLLGRDLYVKPGSYIFSRTSKKADVMLNNHHMSRPICSFCGKRCRDKKVLQCSGSIFCSLFCFGIIFGIAW